MQNTDVEETDNDPNKKLQESFHSLQREWNAMNKQRKLRTSGAPSTTILKALRLADNSPRVLMLALQQNEGNPNQKTIRKLKGRRLFEENDDAYETGICSSEETPSGLTQESGKQPLSRCDGSDDENKRRASRKPAEFPIISRSSSPVHEAGEEKYNLVFKERRRKWFWALIAIALMGFTIGFFSMKWSAEIGPADLLTLVPT